MFARLIRLCKQPSIYRIVAITLLFVCADTYSQDFTFTPSDTMEEQIEESAESWWFFFVDNAVWVTLFMFVVFICFRPLRPYWWVPPLIWAIFVIGDDIALWIQSSANSSTSISQPFDGFALELRLEDGNGYTWS